MMCVRGEDIKTASRYTYLSGQTDQDEKESKRKKDDQNKTPPHAALLSLSPFFTRAPPKKELLRINQPTNQSADHSIWPCLLDPSCVSSASYLPLLIACIQLIPTFPQPASRENARGLDIQTKHMYLLLFQPLRLSLVGACW